MDSDLRSTTNKEQKGLQLVSETQQQGIFDAQLAQTISEDHSFLTRRPLADKGTNTQLSSLSTIKRAASTLTRTQGRKKKKLDFETETETALTETAGSILSSSYRPSYRLLINQYKSSSGISDQEVGTWMMTCQFTFQRCMENPAEGLPDLAMIKRDFELLYEGYEFAATAARFFITEMERAVSISTCDDAIPKKPIASRAARATDPEGTFKRTQGEVWGRKHVLTVAMAAYNAVVASMPKTIASSPRPASTPALAKSKLKDLFAQHDLKIASIEWVHVSRTSYHSGGPQTSKFNEQLERVIPIHIAQAKRISKYLNIMVRADNANVFHAVRSSALPPASILTMTLPPRGFGPIGFVEAMLHFKPGTRVVLKVLGSDGLSTNVRGLYHFALANNHIHIYLLVREPEFQVRPPSGTHLWAEEVYQSNKEHFLLVDLDDFCLDNPLKDSSLLFRDIIIAIQQAKWGLYDMGTSARNFDTMAQYSNGRIRCAGCGLWQPDAEFMIHAWKRHPDLAKALWEVTQLEMCEKNRIDKAEYSSKPKLIPCPILGCLSSHRRSKLYDHLRNAHFPGNEFHFLLTRPQDQTQNLIGQCIEGTNCIYLGERNSKNPGNIPSEEILRQHDFIFHHDNHIAYTARKAGRTNLRGPGYTPNFYSIVEDTDSKSGKRSYRIGNIQERPLFVNTFAIDSTVYKSHVDTNTDLAEEANAAMDIDTKKLIDTFTFAVDMQGSAPLVKSRERRAQEISFSVSNPLNALQGGSPHLPALSTKFAPLTQGTHSKHTGHTKAKTKGNGKLAKEVREQSEGEEE